MPQGAQNSGFTMNDLVSLVFRPQPQLVPLEPSLMMSSDLESPPPLTHYQDDLVGGFKKPEDLLMFLAQHFLPQIEWSHLHLAFKKLQLFMAELVHLGMVHLMGGCI